MALCGFFSGVDTAHLCVFISSDRSGRNFLYFPFCPDCQGALTAVFVNFSFDCRFLSSFDVDR